MKRLLYFPLVMGISLFVSFGPRPTPGITGKFGVSAADPSQIELLVNDDQTFTYHDFSNPQKKIDVRGRWEWKGQRIVLHAETSPYRFHTRWKPTADGMAVRSAHGMTFYRLVRLAK